MMHECVARAFSELWLVMQLLSLQLTE